MESLVFHARPQLRRPALVLAFGGWGDAGQAATTAVRLLAEQFAATPLARLEPEEFYDFTVARPRVHIDADDQRLIEWSAVDFCAAQPQGSPQDYVLGWGPEPHLKWKMFTAAVLQLVRECGVQVVVTLGGYLAEVLYSRPVPVTGFASDPHLLHGVEVTPTRYEGPTGIIGVLGEGCRTAGVTHVSLWAALPHYIAAAPNPRGTLALLLHLSQLLVLPLDLAPLQAEAAAFEAKVNEAVANDPQLSAYVRELKRREFAN